MQLVSLDHVRSAHRPTRYLRHLAFQILDLLSNRAEALQQKLSIFVSLYQAFQAVRIHSSMGTPMVPMVPIVPMVLCHGIHDETQKVTGGMREVSEVSNFSLVVGGFKTCQHLSKHKNTPQKVQKEGTFKTSAIELVQRSLNLKIHRSFL